MQQPELKEFKFECEADLLGPGNIVITMSPGQWDNFLEEAYDMGGILLEIEEKEDGNEYINKAYKKEM